MTRLEQVDGLVRFFILFGTGEEQVIQLFVVSDDCGPIDLIHCRIVGLLLIVSDLCGV